MTAIRLDQLFDSLLWLEGLNNLNKKYTRNRGIREKQVRQVYNDDQVPLKSGNTDTSICNVVVFLAFDQAIYMTGQAISITGRQEKR